MSDYLSPWKRLASKTVYENQWIRVREDAVIRPDGHEGIYGVVTSHPGATIVALDAEDRIYIVGLDRYTTGRFSWELPAGGMDEGNPLEAAKRELKEETGLEAEEWQALGTLQALNGICDAIVHVFVARKLSQSEDHDQKEEGITMMKAVSFSELMEMVRNGEFDESQSLAALMKATTMLGWFSDK